ncbi:MAG: DNA topoisomerase IV subunit A [Candidatus Izemoplasmataceae bacterium]
MAITKRIEEFIEERIIKENLEDIVGERFGRYSKYIIQDRALPDVRDGLKPVQRRILYAMYKLGMFSDKPYKKSARIVGDVIGKYHPHGDSSVYEAMVRLSQPWKMLNPLIDMHGNNGSVDGDSAAAMRYTEARMSKISEYLLTDIQKRTVDFIPNFDDEEYEPTVLPAKYPNLLVNGTTGISAGYATDIPPHNLAEVIAVVVKRIDQKDMTIEQALKIMKGPDFPTGAIVQGEDQIKQAYETGRGRIIIKSKSEIEGQSIIVTEIPYEVNKAVLVRRIDDIRIKKMIDGISEVRDESDRDGLRIVIDVKKDFDPEFILNYLYKKTDLTKSYNYNMVAINNKRPMLMGLFEIVDAYILHQKEVITNRSNYDLKKAERRLHVVDGIIKMLDVLDEVIDLIRKSKNKGDAKSRLQKKFAFSEEQSEAIVTLQLYRLSSTDIKTLQKEKNALNKEITELQLILHNEDELKKVLKKELRAISRLIDAPRKTIIEEEIEKITIVEEELISDEQVALGISKEGYIKRASIRSYKATETATIKDKDAMMFEGEVSTLDTMLLFTNLGNYIYLPVYKLPDYKWKDLGTHINNIVQLEDNERLIKVMRVPSFEESLYVLLATKNNLIKLTPLSDFDVIRYNKTIKAISLNKGDELCSVDVTNNLDHEVLALTSKGHALRFNLAEINVTSTTAKGIKIMNISNKQSIASAIVLKDYHEVLIATNRGTVKRINPKDVPKKKRTLTPTMVLKTVKSNPYLVVDMCLLNQTQYRDRANVRLITENGFIDVEAFEFKNDHTDNGRQFAKKKDGAIQFIQIEELEQQEYQPINDYIKEIDPEEIQQTLFE